MAGPEGATFVRSRRCDLPEQFGKGRLAGCGAFAPAVQFGVTDRYVGWIGQKAALERDVDGLR